METRMAARKGSKEEKKGGKQRLNKHNFGAVWPNPSKETRSAASASAVADPAPW